MSLHRKSPRFRPSATSVAAIAAVRADANRMELAVSQIGNYNYANPAGFPALLRFLDEHLGLSASELAQALRMDADTLDPGGLIPELPIRKKVAAYALKRLKA